MLQIAVPSVLQQSIDMMIVQAVVNPFGTTGTCRLCCDDEGRKCFFTDIVSIGNAVSHTVYPESWCERNHSVSRRAIMLHWC